MLVRDAQQIIVQHSDLDPNYKDGGDSCARTGPMARAGSLIDIDNVPYFITPLNEVVRHPTQPGFNDPAKTSRDNVVQFMCADLDPQRAAALHYAEAGWVNSDILMPDVRYYLYKVARKQAPLYLRVLGPVFLRLSILWASYIQPNEEVNQLACMVSVLDPKYARMLLKHHSKLEDNLETYWNGWRDQSDIGDAILANLKAQASK